MQFVNDLPESISEIEHLWIPLSDGTRLAARVWLPEDAERRPVPALLEYIPYRRRDGVRLRDETMHPYFAGHGYASVRVDLRGSGDSEGVLRDEYLQQELDDGVEVIRWLASRSWCDGNVGMIGISWGGFNGLQIAALAPEALKAVVSVASTDDRYADDVHHMGGCLLGDNLSWASTMFAYNSLPPDPDVVGPGWREMWMDRLENSGLWLEKWLEHQRRDAYWRHGSICENYDAVQCPVMLVSGWADGYSNAVFRMLRHLKVPRLGLVGPWSHKYPHLGVPGPAIGFLQECLRWWDHWLKGRDTGIMQEPMLRAWMQDSMPPTPRYALRPGRWVGETQWPSPGIENRHLALQPGRLVQEQDGNEDLVLGIQSPLSVGLFAGKWCSYAAAPDLPHDQRQEDGGALVFDSDFLDQPVELLGNVIAELEVSADQPVAMVAVRLSDLAPDDKATRVTYGLLNLTHRDGSGEPQPLQPGTFYRVRVRLNEIGYVFPRGHRMRIAVSTSYWPLAWPAPVSARLHLRLAGCSVQLPVRPPRDEDEHIRGFGPAEGTCPSPHEILEPEHHTWRVIRDLESDTSVLEVTNDGGIQQLHGPDLTVQRKALEWYTFKADDYDSVRGETLWERGLRRGDWSVRTVTRTVLRSDRQHFYIDAELDAWEGDRRVYSRNWRRTLRRDLV